jgi:LmbE family N-acetylglucosaminyl deacetylase
VLRLSLGGAAVRLRTLLCIGAHCDDIEIGCGATVLQLVEAYPDLEVWWVVLSSSSVRAAEARASAGRFLRGARRQHLEIKEFRNSFFPFEGAKIKEYFEELKGKVAPDLVLTHTRQDLHQDHRLTCELSWNSFRDHFIIEYEIPKYDGDLGAPNFFVPVAASHVDAKMNNILECFASQCDKPWFTRDTFMALMRLRGVECNSPSRYAEAFYCRKGVLGFEAAPGNV